jgi:SAM-dependent methyltransferase
VSSPVDDLLPLLRCPATGQRLVRRDGEFVTDDGARRYPVTRGVPVLIAEERSLFDLDSITDGGTGGRSSLLGRLLALPPTHTRNVAARANLAELVRLLGGNGRVLVIGGRIIGAGMEALLAAPGVEPVETDVALGPRTQIVCDAHDLPFAEGSFDAVVIQGVLEAVADPERVAAEVHRVLAPDGLVYSEAPFIQQVHEGAYDFNRFTHLGHRRLWRSFDELRSGAQCGPGMALLWSIEYFLQAVAGGSRLLRGLVSRTVTLLFFWLKYLDDFLAGHPGGVDAASGTFFLGRRRSEPLPDREIVRAFQGVPPRGQRLPRISTPSAGDGERGTT